MTTHDDLAAFEAAAAGRRLWLFTSKGTRGLWDAEFADGDWMVFGNEGGGLPGDFVARHAGNTVRIPQAPGERCLNLSTAAGVGLFEALRRCAARSNPPQS